MPGMAVVLLEDIASELERVDLQTSVWLNRVTGEFVLMADYLDAQERERVAEDIDSSSDYEKLPGPHEIREYGIMEEFAQQVSRGKREALLRALNGSKPFRRFKDALHTLDLRESYWRFRHQALIRVAREWCKDSGIPYRDQADVAPQTADVLLDSKE